MVKKETSCETRSIIKNFIKFSLWTAYVYILCEVLICPLVTFTILTLLGGVGLGLSSLIMIIVNAITGSATIDSSFALVTSFIFIGIGKLLTAPLLVLIRFQSLLFWLKVKNQDWAPINCIDYFKKRTTQALNFVTQENEDPKTRSVETQINVQD